MMAAPNLQHPYPGIAYAFGQPERVSMRAVLRSMLIVTALLATWLAAPSARAAAEAPRPAYTLDAQLHYDAATLDVAETVRYRNTTGVPLDRLVFQVTPAYYHAFALESATADGAAVDASQDGTVMDVPLPAPLAPLAETTVALDYQITVPHEAGRFGVSGRTIALGNWFPILAPYRDGWVRHQYADVGDAFFTEAADFDVAVTADRDGVTLAHSGVQTVHDGRQWSFQAERVRDFALVASTAFTVSTAQVGDATVSV